MGRWLRFGPIPRLNIPVHEGCPSNVAAGVVLTSVLTPRQHPFAWLLQAHCRPPTFWIGCNTCRPYNQSRKLGKQLPHPSESDEGLWKRWTAMSRHQRSRAQIVSFLTPIVRLDRRNRVDGHRRSPFHLHRSTIWICALSAPGRAIQIAEQNPSREAQRARAAAGRGSGHPAQGRTWACVTPRTASIRVV